MFTFGRRWNSPRMTSDPVDLYIFTSDTLPSDPRFMPPLTNGLLGWSVFNRVMHMGGVYNGEGGACHRANIPCPLAVQMKTEEVGQHMYKLDMRSGIFSHTIVTPHVEISQVLYAHRQHSNILVMEVFLKRLVLSAEPITIQLESFFNPQSDDITFQNAPDYKGGSAFPSSSEATSPFGGVSPGGLSTGSKEEDYHGHVFWDQDTWMYPGIALFYPSLAKAVLEYRVKTIEGAQANAQQMGFKGLKFAWESAVTGQDVCPVDIYAEQEIHINGDVVFAFEQYFYLTQDLEMFKEGRGSEVVWGVADYWVSRVTWDPTDQQYHMKGVIPPDEYYFTVDNSVFTNAVAQRSLRFALELASLLAQPAPPEWQEVSDKIKIPFDPKLQYHPEFDGYMQGTKVKQADTVLLGYPLGIPMTSEVRRNDLEIYEAVTNPLGPAMTWGMFAVGWLELGETEKAQQLLQKCFKNIQKPFQVWSESSDGSGCVNFLTGMGGFLQAVLFGYTGFRVQKEGLAFAPLLPREVDALNVKGVSYLGNKMDWLIKGEEVSVMVRKPAEDSGSKEPYALEVVLNTGTTIPLIPGQSVTFPRQPGQIRKQNSGSYCWLL
ncbi:protein-glucosylgalactosylhydroxylysine glucosidase isoform X6 [Myxocyprinus asiaticus]|uniref:protein-glucosylgalactosylhydroxylysine glucosidase isoform X6 n=1 Tax=Myxocyprinus asiaticus TaxID=70543 RepID=UPI0022220426|nr:protein-glucosylgalactosylhydroxylysine glucosidase isoform X6 [Myxocyprinus asiaticus]